MGLLDTPDWVNQYVAKWKQKLHLTQWRITNKIALAPGGRVDSLAICTQTQNVAEAHLTFRADIEDNQDWQETILHEILHIAHGTVDQAVWCTALDGVSDEKKSMGYQAYSDAMEKFIDQLSKLLWEMENPNAASSQETNNHEGKPFGFLPPHPRPESASRMANAKDKYNGTQCTTEDHCR